MAVLKNPWPHIRTQLTSLDAKSRWIIGLVTIVLVVVGFLLLLYAAQPETVRVAAIPADKQAKVTQRMQSAGIDAKIEAGQLWVPAGRRDEAYAILFQDDLMAGDTSAIFDELVSKQNPWMSSAQNAQAYLLAKQKVLSQIIGKMRGVRSADVMISLPEDKGFGRTHVRPSASVNVVSSGREHVDKRMVEAIAGLVSGAVAGMKPQDVVVIDANLGRQFTVKSADDVLPGETLELVHQIEQYHRDKIAELLAYIPGVIVAVNVQTDPIHKKQVEEITYESAEPLRSETNKEMERKEMTDGGAPGARSNTMASIEASTASGSSERTTETRSEFGEKNPTKRAQYTEVGHQAKQINVTINVPRSFFVHQFKQGKTGDVQEPDDAALKPIVDAQLAKIADQVKPLIATAGTDGVVRTDMVPDTGLMLALAGGRTASQAGVVMGLDVGLIKPIGLGLLALASLGLMLNMVRKAMKAPPLPSVEELAGVPPTLPVLEDELVGEAEEHSPSMAGVELDEEELRHRKIAEQISDLVKANPTEVAKLFFRWVRTED